MTTHITTAVLVCLCLILVLPCAQPIRYHVSNNARGTQGGDAFDKIDGETLVKQVLPLATAFVWLVLNITDPALRKSHTDVFVEIKLHEDSVYGAVGGYAKENKIVLNSRFYTSGYDKLPELVVGILYHELTHVWQRIIYGRGAETAGIREGVAHYVGFRAGYQPQLCGSRGKIQWEVKQAPHWYKGYCPTAVFFEYLNTLNHGFVANLVSRLADHGYTDRDFLGSLGLFDKSPEGLWDDFVRDYTKEEKPDQLQQVARDLPYLL